MARPVSVHLAGAGGREAVGVDDPELPVLRVGIALDQLLDHRGRLVADVEEP
jgi:hypothetical protein